ncbi:NAD(P)-binding protein, partial [bacterium]|nr:NAD(P)-binding protein [bacterium]
MKIGIVGSGVLGLTLGYYLQKQRHQVHIYERNSYIGGLACSFDYGKFIWDKFYHVIMSHDHYLLELLHEIGLEKHIQRGNAGAGYFANGKFYSLSNFRQMLRFPLLNWFDKTRMTLAILYSLSLTRPGSLYNQTAKEWLIRIFGKSNYINFWKPLLRAKFGEYAEKVAAVFIWASLKRLLGARFNSSFQGTTCYV